MSWEKAQGLQKVSRYCAYQERCRQEVVQKLRKLECPEEEMEEVLEALAEDGFWNEERFARAYVRGKFRQLGWGRIRLQIELRKKGVPEAVAARALAEEIDEGAYQEELRRQLEKRVSGLAELRDPVAKQKVIRHLQSRGYAFEDIVGGISDWLSEEQ